VRSIRTARCRRSSIPTGPAALKSECSTQAPFCSIWRKRPGNCWVHPPTAEKLPYAINRYRREAERHYAVLDKHLEGRSFIVGDGYTIADISAWGWIDRASFVLPGTDDPLAAYPNIRRWFHLINDRPAVAKTRAVGSSHAFKKEVDEETRRALFPSNYPPAAA
jgi:glutathione S-transferase